MATVDESLNFAPFGLPACEDEVESAAGRDEYKKLYLRNTPFDDEASKNHTYLIVGRRGAGKTALAQSFRFNPKFSNPRHIFVEPQGYHNILKRLQNRLERNSDTDLEYLVDIWERAIWRLLDSGGADGNGDEVRLGDLVRSIFVAESKKRSRSVRDEREEMSAMQQRVLGRAAARPFVLAIDTLERYSISDTNLLRSIAALIQFASRFNRLYPNRGVHLKVLMSGEIFPHLSRHILDNPLKSLRNTVFLLWRPKPLLRLLAYRFHRFLSHEGYIDAAALKDIDWNDYDDVLAKAWTPYFGTTILNSRGVREHTFPYLLRHTQMRPRQMIVLCNKVSERARSNNRFPRMSNEDLVKGTEQAEEILADEVINVFSKNLRNMEKIIHSLSGCSMLFTANELNGRAKAIREEWKLQEELGKYSVDAYRALLAEMGIIGIVKKRTGQYVQAEFEYSVSSRLDISDQDECVVHPMFYRLFRVKKNIIEHVLPFAPELLANEEL